MQHALHEVLYFSFLCCLYKGTSHVLIDTTKYTPCILYSRNEVMTVHDLDPIIEENKQRRKKTESKEYICLVT